MNNSNTSFVTFKTKTVTFKTKTVTFQRPKLLPLRPKLLPLRPKLLPLGLVKPVIPRAQGVSKSLKTKILNIKYLKQQQTRAWWWWSKIRWHWFLFFYQKIETNYVHPKHKRALLEKKRTNPQKGHVPLSQTIKYSHRNAQDAHRPVINENGCISLLLLLRTILDHLWAFLENRRRQAEITKGFCIIIRLDRSSVHQKAR